MTKSPLDIDALAKLVKEATELPWVLCRETPEFGTIGTPVFQMYNDEKLVGGHRLDWGDGAEPKMDALFIVTACNALPALISAARERDALRAALAECVADFEEAIQYKGYLAEKHGDREAIERYRLLLKDPQ